MIGMMNLTMNPPKTPAI